MLAMTLLFQSLRFVFPGLALVSLGPFNLLQILVGILVNMCLLITAWNAGILPGLLLSALAPAAAFMQGQMPIPHMIAVAALGNAVLCLIAWIPGAKEWTRFALTLIAALAKFGVMSQLVLRLVIPILLPSALSEAAAVTKASAALSAAFVWPQLVTAAAGGLLAFTISHRLPKIAE